MAREAFTPHNFGDKPYLGFEHVTMVPMCRKLIVETLMTPRERDWLNTYHKEVWKRTSHYFEGRDERTLKWLRRETTPI